MEDPQDIRMTTEREWMRRMENHPVAGAKHAGERGGAGIGYLFPVVFSGNAHVFLGATHCSVAPDRSLTHAPASVESSSDRTTRLQSRNPRGTATAMTASASDINTKTNRGKPGSTSLGTAVGGRTARTKTHSQK